MRPASHSSAALLPSILILTALAPISTFAIEHAHHQHLGHVNSNANGAQHHHHPAIVGHARVAHAHDHQLGHPAGRGSGDGHGQQVTVGGLILIQTSDIGSGVVPTETDSISTTWTDELQDDDRLSENALHIPSRGRPESNPPSNPPIDLRPDPDSDPRATLSYMRYDRRAGAPASTDTAGQAIYSSEQAALTDSTTVAGAGATTTAVAGGAGTGSGTTMTTSSAVTGGTTSAVGAVTGGTTSSGAATTSGVASEVIVTDTATASASLSTTSTTSAVPTTTSTTSTSSIVIPSTTSTTSAAPLTVTIQSTLAISSSTTTALASSISLLKTSSVSKTVATATGSSTAVAASSDATTGSTGLSKTTIIALIVVGCVLVAVAAGWTLFRKWKLKPRSRFDARLQPLDFSPSNDLPDPFMEKTRRAGAGAGAGAYGRNNRMSGTSMTSISSADRQRRQFVNELDLEYEGGAGMGEKDGYDHQQQQMRYGPMGYPPLMNDLPGHDFTAAPVSSAVGYPPMDGGVGDDGGYANLRRAPSTAGTNFAGFGAGTRGIDTGVAPGGYYGDHAGAHGGGGDHGMEMMSGGGVGVDPYGAPHGGNGQQYLDEDFTGGMGYGRPMGGDTGPYAAASHFAGNGARY